MKNLLEFYPFYLSEHRHGINRILHFIGSSCGLIFLFLAIYHRRSEYVLAALISGYFFAWIGHFIIEKNRPATFKYPLLSFISDWMMFFELLTMKRKFFNDTSFEKYLEK